MKYVAILFIYLFIIPSALSQNLVYNSSFEIYEVCPEYYTEKPVKELIPGWNLPTRGSSDYFNSCSRFQVNVPNNFIGHMFAKDGQAYAGILLLQISDDKNKKNKTSDYREYLQTELIKPLVKGKKYQVKFYYSIATYSTYAINNLGIYISNNKIKNRLSTKTLQYIPQIKMNQSTLNITKDSWCEVCDTIIANGGEKFLTIGNFFTDDETEYKELDLSDVRKSLHDKIKKNKTAYYYIDLISVSLIED